jgi:glycosyltransferase involved in cell wall biosynthesis
MTGVDHTFALLAYQKSSYLEDCIVSLKNQTVRSRTIITTSTPSLFLEEISRKYGLPLLINMDGGGIASDWSFAYQCADTKYVTLAHQDDVYHPRYAERCLANAGRSAQSLIIFTDYDELVGEKRIGWGVNLVIKKSILFPFFAVGQSLKNRLLKKWMLSLGSPIPCPSVMYHKEAIGDFRFSDDFTVNLDWEAWIRLAERAGEFVFIRERLMTHRIHAESATTRAIRAGKREAEDRALFFRIWGAAAGRLIARMYRLSYISND